LASFFTFPFIGAAVTDLEPAVLNTVRRMKRALALVVLLVACGGKAAGHRAAGALRLRAGDVAGALGELRVAVQANPADAEAWALLGDALFEAQRYEEAEKSLRTALELDRGTHPVRRALAQLAVRRGRLPEAERLLRELAAEAPRDPDLQVALGTLLASRGDLGGAKAAFERALAAVPRHAAALYDLGRAHLRTGDLAGAQAAFERLDKVKPEAPYAPYGLALVHARRHENEAACAALYAALGRSLFDRRAAERDPELAPVRHLPCFGELLVRREGRP
jgi:Flp pilus assembly protein TadD